MSTNRLAIWKYSTGGWSYHYLAWKYKNRFWKDYRAQLTGLLDAWRPFTQNLILVGPSAGYSLNSSFLDRFQNIWAYESDPVAQLIFQKRFPRNRILWKGSCPIFSPESDPKKELWKMRSDHPNTAILFCNILGQWPLLDPSSEQKFQDFIRSLNELFADSRWASFHDLFSGPLSQPLRDIRLLPPLKQPLNEMQQVECLAKQLKMKSLTNHLTFGQLQPSKAKTHFFWPLSPTQLHIMEWVQS